MKKYLLSIGENEYNVEVKELDDEKAVIFVNGKDYRVELKQIGDKEQISKISQSSYAKNFRRTDKNITEQNSKKNSRTLERGGALSPLPGTIIKIHADEGERIKAGDAVVTLEAMKMENIIKSPYDGTVKKIFFNVGDNVLEGDLIAEICRPMMTTL